VTPRRRAQAVGVVAAGAVVAHVVPGVRARRAMHWQADHGRVHHGTLTARLLGAEGTPIVLLHGQAGSGRYWGGAYDDLGVTAPAVLVAHSLGCLVALRLATRRPDRVSAVLGFGPPLYRDAADARSHLRNLGVGTRLFAMDTPVARALYGALCGRYPRLAGVLARLVQLELPGPIAQDGVRYSWHSYSDTLRRLILAAPAIDWLPQLHVPVRLVIGGADRIPDRPLLRELAAHPLLAVEVWPGGGHHLPLTHPQRCPAAITAVLKRVDGDDAPSPAHRPEDARRPC
jgi:pimeloyl-ACP methyl ester carboxylesterase